MTRRARHKAPPASPQSLAACNFKAWPEAVAAIGSGPEFLATLTEKVNPLVIGLAVLKYDDAALTERLRAAGDDMLETALAAAQYLAAQAGSFRALANFCETAEVRTMIVLSRITQEREA